MNAAPPAGRLSAAPFPGPSVRATVVRGLLIAAALAYVGVLLLAPMGGIVFSVVHAGWDVVVSTLSAPDVVHAFLLTAIITGLVVAATTVMGVVTALTLARDSFPGHRLVDALIDLPFALSPVVVGLMAVLLFGSTGWFGPTLAAHGIHVLFALPSMVLVTAFIAVPFTIREVVPVLEASGTEEEEAARTLGASAWQVFRHITVPKLRWALAYGIALSAARSIGEVGAVLIVSGAIQGRTETATLFVYRAMENRQPGAAYVVSLCLAAVSVLLLTGIEALRRRHDRIREVA